ncbi:MAG: dihydroorotate dehydrogenase-like protein [Alphaproteobacteria bacterium]|nr:dihydroorotate dehydrogenase-like protein [Alphaproteobacteria bacterium]MBF0128665.1 dihydroorotate dehydrogenase-like protein [Alphaproteobacteria bacterium]
MDLSTRYLGLDLPHPIMPGASTMTNDMDVVRRLEDAGAAAICLPSLFEEQLISEHQSILEHEESVANSAAEATSFFPRLDDYKLGPESYLEHIRKTRAAVSVPVIASLNGTTGPGWAEYAKLIQDAGAHAIELNMFLVARLDDTAAKVEDRIVKIATDVRKEVSIPVAVKLTPFFSALGDLVGRVERAGIDGVVLFNRVYQPDIDIENLEMIRRGPLSSSAELLLRVRWVSILSGRSKCSFAVSGGVQDVTGVIKSVMAGAHAVQTVSALMRHGPEYLKTMKDDLTRWLEEHEYASLKQMQGSMDLSRSPNPAALLRASYVTLVQSTMASVGS